MKDLDKFKNEMNLSGQNVYVGHRYVPKIIGEWDNTQIYEPLSIVQYQGASYTSRQYVPVGVELTNEEYWVVTGNYNAQVEQYRQDVVKVSNDVTNLTTNVNNEIGRIDVEIDDIDEYIKINNQLYINALNPPKPLIAAKGDGVSDDTEAINAQLKYAYDNGVKLILPSGEYLVNLVAEGWGVNIEGVSSYHTILKPFDKDKPVFTDNGVMRRNSGFKHLKIVGDIDHVGGTGIKLTRQSYLDIYEDVTIENFDIGLDVEFSWGFHLDAFELKNNNTGMRVKSTDGVNALSFTRGKISGNKIGVDFIETVGHSLSFENSSLEGNEIAVRFNNLYGSIKFENCYFEHNDKHMVGLSGATSRSAIIDVSNSWLYIGASNQFEFNSPIQMLVMNNNEISIDGSNFENLLYLIEANYLRFNNVITGSSNVKNYVSNIENIEVIEATRPMIINGRLENVNKNKQNKLTVENNKRFSDVENYTTYEDTIGSGGVDVGYSNGYAINHNKTSGRLTIDGVVKKRDSDDRKIFSINNTGHLTINGGFQYMYTTARLALNLTLADRGYTVFDRDLNKLCILTQDSGQNLIWVDAMGNTI